MVNVSKQKGSALLIAIVALVLVMASAIRIGHSMQAEKVILNQNLTSAKVRQILLGLNEHYIAKCYEGAGVYADPLNVQEIVDGGFLSKGNYQNHLGGDFIPTVRKEGDIAIMRLEARFDDFNDAMSILEHQIPSVSAEYFNLDNKIRWEMINKLNSGVDGLQKKKIRDTQGGMFTC
jgi:hypothetical protein